MIIALAIYLAIAFGRLAYAFWLLWKHPQYVFDARVFACFSLLWPMGIPDLVRRLWRLVTHGPTQPIS